MNPWPDKEVQDFHHISIVKDKNKEFGILKNDQGQFVSIETNMPLNGNYKIEVIRIILRTAYCTEKFLGQPIEMVCYME